MVHIHGRVSVQSNDQRQINDDKDLLCESTIFGRTVAG
jgi:hypothetical protein